MSARSATDVKPSISSETAAPNPPAPSSACPPSFGGALPLRFPPRTPPTWPSASPGAYPTSTLALVVAPDGPACSFTRHSAAIHDAAAGVMEKIDVPAPGGTFPGLAAGCLIPAGATLEASPLGAPTVVPQSGFFKPVPGPFSPPSVSSPTGSLSPAGHGVRSPRGMPSPGSPGLIGARGGPGVPHSIARSAFEPLLLDAAGRAHVVRQGFTRGEIGLNRVVSTGVAAPCGLSVFPGPSAGLSDGEARVRIAVVGARGRLAVVERRVPRPWVGEGDVDAVDPGALARFMAFGGAILEADTDGWGRDKRGGYERWVGLRGMSLEAHPLFMTRKCAQCTTRRGSESRKRHHDDHDGVSRDAWMRWCTWRCATW